MDTATLVGIITAVATCLGVFGGLFTYFHSLSAKARETMKADLKNDIEKLSSTMTREHEVVKKQVMDMGATLSSNYVLRTDFNSAITGFHTVVGEARKEIGSVHNRLDDIFKNVEWRRRAGDSCGDD
jgi:hypothetical protein